MSKIITSIIDLGQIWTGYLKAEIPEIGIAVFMGYNVSFKQNPEETCKNELLMIYLWWMSRYKGTFYNEKKCEYD